jgi:hypothetical protein
VSNGFEAAAERLWRVGVEGIVFGFHRPAGALIGPSCVALGDESPNSGREPGCDYMVCPFGSQAVRQREFAVEVAQILPAALLSSRRFGRAHRRLPAAPRLLE